MKRIFTYSFIILFIGVSPIANAQQSSVLQYLDNIPELSNEPEMLNRSKYPGVCSRNDARMSHNDSILEYFCNIPELKAQTEVLVLDRKKFRNVFSREESYALNHDTLNIATSKKVAQFGSGNFYNEIDKNGHNKKKYTGFGINHVIGHDYINPYVYVESEYDSNDRLVAKRIGSCLFDFYIGKEYRYDTSGKVKLIIDHNENFRYPIKDIVAYCVYLEGIDIKAKTDYVDNEENFRMWSSSEEIFNCNQFLNKQLMSSPLTGCFNCESYMATKDLNVRLLKSIKKYRYNTSEGDVDCWRLDYETPINRTVILNIDAKTGQVLYRSVNIERYSDTLQIKRRLENPNNPKQRIRRNEVVKYDTNGNLQQYYSGFATNEVIGREYINPYVYVEKQYYSNDTLKSKRVYCTLGFFIGKEYRYDKRGILIETIDHDKGLYVQKEQIVSFCESRGIDFSQVYNGKPMVQINKDCLSRKWYVYYPINSPYSILYDFIVFDGKSDEELKINQEYTITHFQNIPPLSPESEVLMRTDFPGIAGDKSPDSLHVASAEKDYYSEYDTSGMMLKSYRNFNNNRIEGRDYLNPYFYVEKKYYANDKLKSKVIRCKFGPVIGKEYHYDETGTLTKTIDHDITEGYDLIDILNYCKGWRIDVSTISKIDDNEYGYNVYFIDKNGKKRYVFIDRIGIIWLDDEWKEVMKY